MDKERRQIYVLMGQLERTSTLLRLESSVGLSEEEVLKIANEDMALMVKHELVCYSPTGRKYIVTLPDIEQHSFLKVYHDDDV